MLFLLGFERALEDEDSLASWWQYVTAPWTKSRTRWGSAPVA